MIIAARVEPITRADDDAEGARARGNDPGRFAHV
jgi:hypothetical protein